MFEVLMRDHAVKQVKLFNLPKSKEEPAIKKRKRMETTEYQNQQQQNDAGPSLSTGDAVIEDAEPTILTSCIVPKVRGHTSFLTFATLFPAQEKV